MTLAVGGGNTIRMSNGLNPDQDQHSGSKLFAKMISIATARKKLMSPNIDRDSPPPDSL